MSASKKLPVHEFVVGDLVHQTFTAGYDTEVYTRLGIITRILATSRPSQRGAGPLCYIQLIDEHGIRSEPVYSSLDRIRKV